MLTPLPVPPSASPTDPSSGNPLLPPGRLPARLVLRVGDAALDAVPLALTGQDAEVLLERAVAPAAVVRLTVAWDAGGSTSLPATVRAVRAGGCRARLDVHGIEGDWQPFLTWLGTHA